jgi:hypothetical protein
LIEKAAAKAKADMLELMRDLSTYESNFGIKDYEALGLSLTSVQRRIKAT